MVDRHVEHQADAERERAKAERDDLERENQRREPPRGAHEVLEVPEAVLFDAVVVEREEDDDRAAEGDVPRRRRRVEPGNQAEHVGEEDEARARADEREVTLGALRTHHVLHQVVEVPDEDLEERAERELVVGDDRFVVLRHRHLAAHDEGEQDEEEHDERAREQRLGAARLHLFVPDERVAELAHLVAETERRDQVAEERCVLGHGLAGVGSASLTISRFYRSRWSQLQSQLVARQSRRAWAWGRPAYGS